MPADEFQPLLREDRQAQRDAENDHIHEHIVWLSPAGEDSILHTTRTKTQRFLTSKFGHYAVLLLVSLDVSCIFADFLIGLYTCEQSCKKGQGVDREWREARNALGIVSLIFSCLFMAELLASIWSFGLPYFKSKFHCFDAIVIVAGFVVDVCLKNTLEEVASLVVVLRLWRVFKIIEEFSAGAEERMDTLTERIDQLDMENKELKTELDAIKMNGSSGQMEGAPR